MPHLNVMVTDFDEISVGIW